MKMEFIKCLTKVSPSTPSNPAATKTKSGENWKHIMIYIYIRRYIECSDHYKYIQSVPQNVQTDIWQ